MKEHCKDKGYKVVQISHADLNEYSGDYNQLLYLRARYYAPTTGRFLTKDPSRAEKNLYLYAAGNPINRSDPTGLDSGLLGPEMFGLCFDLHSLLMGQPPMVTVQQAIIICRGAFQKDTWNPTWFNFGGSLPQSAHDLMGWYLYEQGNSHLWFDGDQPLTKELAKSTLIHDIRLRYYFGHGDTSGKIEQRFGYTQFMRSIIWDSKSSINKFSLPISFFLGSFYYQVRTLPNNRIGFRIDNVTSLGSGTHIVGRYDDEYFDSVEGLLQQGLIDGNDRLSDVVKKNPVISILSSRTRGETENPLGGGNLYQTYTWTEPRSDCPGMLWFDYVPLPEPEFKDAPDSLGFSSIQPWPDYQTYTRLVYENER